LASEEDFRSTTVVCLCSGAVMAFRNGGLFACR
jgi:hypothetical protein